MTEEAKQPQVSVTSDQPPKSKLNLSPNPIIYVVSLLVAFILAPFLGLGLVLVLGSLFPKLVFGPNYNQSEVSFAGALGYVVLFISFSPILGLVISTLVIKFVRKSSIKLFLPIASIATLLIVAYLIFVRIPCVGANLFHIGTC